jgi:hypothetical protein
MRAGARRSLPAQAGTVPEFELEFEQGFELEQPELQFEQRFD